MYICCRVYLPCMQCQKMGATQHSHAHAVCSTQTCNQAPRSKNLGDGHTHALPSAGAMYVISVLTGSTITQPFVMTLRLGPHAQIDAPATACRRAEQKQAATGRMGALTHKSPMVCMK